MFVFVTMLFHPTFFWRSNAPFLFSTRTDTCHRRFESPAGILLTVVVWIVYAIALKYEG